MQAYVVRGLDCQLTLRRRVLYFCMVLLIMLETLKRFSESAAYSISMWIMEFLVLALIAYEVFAAICRHWRVKKRLKVLFSAMTQGQKLENDAPFPNSAKDSIDAWRSSVKHWIQETQTLLRSYSAQAEASFLHDPHTIPPNYRISVAEYHLLITRLNNLRGIMEKPEVYF